MRREITGLIPPQDSPASIQTAGSLSIPTNAASLFAETRLRPVRQPDASKEWRGTSTRKGRLTCVFTGTADRTYCGLDIAGLRGFRMPEGLDKDAQREYRKVVTIRWKPEYERLGHLGGHTDCVKASFVQVEVAPLLMALPRILAHHNEYLQADDMTDGVR